MLLFSNWASLGETALLRSAEGELFMTTWTKAMQPPANMSEAADANAPARYNRRQAPSRSIFDVPAPIKHLFDRFPLLAYSANQLPHRAPRDRQEHVLYVFTTDEGALRGTPSFNPACLKWQVGALPRHPSRLLKSNPT